MGADMWCPRVPTRSGLEYGPLLYSPNLGLIPFLLVWPMAAGASWRNGSLLLQKGLHKNTEHAHTFTRYVRIRLLFIACLLTSGPQSRRTGRCGAPRRTSFCLQAV